MQPLSRGAATTGISIVPIRAAARSWSASQGAAKWRIAMKKWITVFLSVFVLLTMAGCGQSAGRTEEQESSPDLENTASAGRQAEATDDTAGSEELPSAAEEAGNEGTPPVVEDTNIGGEDGSPVVYMTTDISPEGLMAIYEALGAEPDGKVAVKLSTGEDGSNYLRPELIGDLVQALDATIVECNTAYGGQRANTAMHYQLAEDHGYTAIADVDIQDSDGSMTLEVAGGDNLTENYVGRILPITIIM